MYTFQNLQLEFFSEYNQKSIKLVLKTYIDTYQKNITRAF